MYTVVKKTEGKVRIINDQKTATNFITKDITSHMSLAVLHLTHYTSPEMAEYNRIYYVTEGVIKLTFNNQVHELTVGDTCFIVKGTAYHMSGTGTVVVINQPAFGT